ncbi:DUF4279 domain-containing protein [Microbacterium sp. OVT16B]|uniref:DUF4279 domain-containing protein n=1 Tax=Microbacterium sp. OVT16B TaxID=2862682 RepID=UPI001CBEC7A8|nr:DUF4279 domain-containing protein [Microbacterium sp. OVT16B]
MRIRQYVYFALDSETVPAADISGVLASEPDRFTVRASRRSEPPIPIQHSWQVRCDEPGLTIDEQIERVLGRVRPLVEPIATLVETTDVTARLQIVRDFNARDGEDEVLDEIVTPDGEILTKLPGQHQLLGWGLEPADLAFLVRIGASLDCDEYGS